MPSRRNHFVLVEIGRIAGRCFLQPIRRRGLRLTLVEREQRSAAALAGEDDAFEAALLLEVAHRRRDIEQQLLVNAVLAPPSALHAEAGVSALGGRTQHVVPLPVVIGMHRHDTVFGRFEGIEYSIPSVTTPSSALMDVCSSTIGSAV